MNFIKTSDEATVELLKKEGFIFHHKEGNFYVFVNDKRLTFSGDSRKVTYTNKLLF